MQDLGIGAGYDSTPESKPPTRWSGVFAAPRRGARPARRVAKALLARAASPPRRRVVAAQRGCEVLPVEASIAPAVRRLGVFWEEVACDFFLESPGMARLSPITSEKARRGAAPAREPVARFVTSHGEMRRFGAAFAWMSLPRAGRGGLVRRSAQAFESIAAPDGWQRFLRRLANFLNHVRSAARPERRSIAQGGAQFARPPNWSCVLSADVAAQSAQAALRVSRALIERQSL